MRRSALLVVALVLLLVACGDDSDTDGATTDTPAIDASGEVDTEALTEELRTAIMGDSGETFDPELEVRQAVVDATGPTGLVVGPVDPAETLSAEEADTVCAAAATVVLRVLPTAVTIIVDGDGAPLVATIGPGGSCTDVSGTYGPDAYADVVADAEG